jgi:hypothetical protein
MRSLTRSALSLTLSALMEDTHPRLSPLLRGYYPTMECLILRLRKPINVLLATLRTLRS